MADIYFQSEANKLNKKHLMVWKISDLANKAGKVVTSHILFVHAWSGCDTTSATFGHGQTNLLEKMKATEELQHTSISSLMSDPDVMAEHIGKAGIRLFVIMYDGRRDDSLNILRYAKFMEIVSSTKTSLDPPETSTYRKSSILSQFAGSLTSHTLE